MKKNIFLIVFRIISLIVMLVSLFFILEWVKENTSNKQMQAKLLANVHFDSENNFKPNINFDEIIAMNNQTVAWIKVNGTDINYSVVKANDNDFYLNHSFDKTYNTAGWIFADYRNKFDGTDKNIIIYGHNRKDGSMFSSLKNTLEDNWQKDENNLIINLYTPTKNYSYKVFSIYQVPVEGLSLELSFANNNDFSNYLKTLQNKSIYNFNVNLDGTQSILTLYTCGNNNAYRIILHASLIND